MTNEEEVEQLKEKIQKLENKNKELKNKIQKLEHKHEVRKGEVGEELAKLRQRITGIENELGLEEYEYIEQLLPNSSKIERISALPEEAKQNLSKDVQRATIIWENFEEWCKAGKKGRIIKSSQLKKLLSTKTNENLHYSQVYRAMKTFEEYTPENYQYMKNHTDGKILMKTYNW